jgi:spermidine synthase
MLPDLKRVLTANQQNSKDPATIESIVPISRWRLKSLVFISGAVLMGLEMAGSRVLAIHFGSSIYVWGSIIGIFLAALAAGYYAGGLAADRKPSFMLLNLIALIAGCWLVLLPFYDNFIARGIRSTNLGARIEPLLATVVLFGGPSILMGMVSPFSVRLSAFAVERIGNVAGRLYALSTLGSIAGTLVTAFWLVPMIGVNTILKALGLALIVISLVGMPRSRASLKIVAPLLMVVLAGLLIKAPAFIPLRLDQHLLYDGDSPYHHIMVIDDDHTNNRMLMFDNYSQSIVSRTPPYESNSYTNSFQVARIFKPNPKRVLFIGGGGAVGPRKFLSEDPDVRVDLVEIDPMVVQLSYDYFHLTNNDRLHVYIEDGRRFVRRAAERYDLVVLDAFTVRAHMPFHLATREFMQEIKERLAPGGVFLVNVVSAIDGSRSRILRSEYKTAASVFDSLYVFPRPFDPERGQAEPLSVTRPRNVMLIALNGSEQWSAESIAKSARSLQEAGLVHTPTFLDDALNFYVGRVRTDDVPLLTDNYAPIDTMVF